jgi:hypothetical protein
MSWKFCIDTPEQKALELCYGNMEMFDGFGDGDDCGDTAGGGEGFSSNYGTLCGDGFSWGEGHGYIVNNESEFFPNHYGWIDGDGISSQDW